MSKFNAGDYLRYRLHYPEKIFHPLRSAFSSFELPLKVLDLGAGTGLVSESFLRFYSSIELTVVEPDRAMLNEAVTRLKEHSSFLVGKLSRAEDLLMPADYFDLILVGSAWHWMNSEETLNRLTKMIKPLGLVYIFEYQFPKAGPEFEGINEWVRRQFNLHWRAPSQAPRGTLHEITECLRSSPSFSQRSKTEFTHQELQDVDQFSGMIFSQSRFLHFESTLPEAERAKYRSLVKEILLEKWGLNNQISFFYPYQGFLFQKRPGMSHVIGKKFT